MPPWPPSRKVVNVADGELLATEAKVLAAVRKAKSEA